MKQKILRTGICLLFSFLLALSLTVLVSSASLACTVLQTHFVSGKIDDRLCEQAYAALLEELHTLGEPSRIPAEVFDGVVTKAMVENELKAYVTTAWAGQPYVAQYSTVESDFYQAFEAYALSQGMEVTSETEEGLQTLATYCRDKYTDYTTIPFLYTVSGAVEMGRKLLWVAMVGAVALSLGLVVLLMKLQPFVHRSMRYIVYALISVLLITVPLPAYLYLSRPYARLNLTPLYVRDLFASMADQVLLAFLISGLVVAASAALVLWGIWRLRKRLLESKEQQLLEPEDFATRTPRHAR